MGAVLAEAEAQGLALLELALAVRRAQRRPSRQNDHELLVGVVVVVRIGRLAWRHLPEARPDQLGAELVADSRPPGPEARRTLTLLEVRLVDAWRQGCPGAAAAT